MTNEPWYIRFFVALLAAAMIGLFVVWAFSAGVHGCYDPAAFGPLSDVYVAGERAASRKRPTPTPTMVPFGPITFNFSGRTIRGGLYYVDNGDGTFTLRVPVTPIPTATPWTHSFQWATPDPRRTP